MNARDISGMRLLQVLAISLAMSGAASAQTAPSRPEPMHPAPQLERINTMFDLVDATPAQRAQVQAIMDRTREELKATRQSLHDLREQSMALLTAATVDGAAIEALRLRQQAIQNEASKRMSQATVESVKLLTAEQRAKLAQRLKQHQAQHPRSSENQ